MKDSLERHQLQLGQNHEGSIKILRDLSLIYRYHNQPYRAEENLLKIVEYYRSKLKEDDSLEDFRAINRALSSLIIFYIGQGKYQTAETLFKERLDISQQHVKAIERRITQINSNSPEGISLSYHHSYASQEILHIMESLARFYLLENRYSEAEKVLLEARFLALEDRSLFNIDISLVEMYIDHGEYNKAKNLLNNLEKTLAIDEFDLDAIEDVFLRIRFLDFLHWRHHLSMLQEDYSSALDAIHQKRKLIQSSDFQSVSYSNYINSGYYQDLAIIYGLMGEYDKYVALLGQVGDAEEDILGTQILGGTESQKQALLNSQGYFILKTVLSVSRPNLQNRSA
ncbi:tetratricopeptide repeat protein [Nodosilinea sp. AN01ver1]|uniref:tetratricopeptide repeat protein n=1 Tax=Nodosilinea sp. AN01ver1 TaxID=3423362 RepID=UPI003D3173A6